MPWASISSRPGAGAVGGHDALELAEHALGRDALDPGGVAAGRGGGGRVDLEIELGHEADGAQRAQRVVGERGLGDHAHRPRLEVGAAAVRVEQLAAAQRLGHRVDGEVARREVGADVAVSQGDEVDVPAVAGADDAPGPEGAGELEATPARRARDRPRGLARVALEREVDVVGRPPEQPVADGAADEPRLPARERLARRLERLRSRLPVTWYPRGTRA